MDEKGAWLSSFILALLLFSAGFYALSGATPGTATPSRWAGGTPGSIVTEGGNITSAAISSASLTDKWAAFFGNVTGGISLTDGSFTVYNWTWAATGEGEVCASTGSSVGSTYNNTTGAAIDAAWSFPSASDNATSTFTSNNCTLAFALGSVASTANATHKGGIGSPFTTCALTIGGTAKSNYFFCTAINATGLNFMGQNASYEIMVPTSYGTITETYYFYAELS